MPDYEQERIYVLFSSELVRLLDERGVSPEDVIRQAGASDARSVPDPASPDPSAEGARDIATVIFASAALVAAATPVIVQIIKTLVNHTPKIIERELTEVTDEQGKVVKRWRERYEKPTASSTGIKVGPGGLEISLSA